VDRARRLALIVANDEYDDAGLRKLKAPAHDAAALAEILRDPGVGSFDVSVLHNRSTQEIRGAVEDFFIDTKSDDLLLLHFSCHGMKNADGELYLALRDTRPDRLASTGLPADFVNRMMASSRAQRIALFLDCCYGGAFPRGMLVRAAGEAHVQDAFAQQEEVGGRRGRVVVTASNAMQYAFEAGELSEETVRPSVFTGALVDGLTTGEADKDQDGWIGITELFSFVAEKVRQETPNQQPQMWTFGAQGDIVIARSRIRRVRPTPLEPAVADAMANPLAAARYGLVDLFRERLGSDDLGLALSAHQALTSMVADDSRRVADAASAALAGSECAIDPPSLDLVVDETGSATGVLTLSGPPIATAVTARVDVPWLSVEHDDPRLLLRVDPPLPTGTSVGTLTLKSPIDEHDVVVRATVPGAATAPSVAAATPHVGGEPPGAGSAGGGRLPWVAAAVAVLVFAGAGLAVALNGEEEPGADAEPTPTPTPTSSGSLEPDVRELAVGRVVAAPGVTVPQASTRVAMGGRDAGVRVTAFGEVDQIGTGGDVRVAAEGARLVAFTLAKGPCVDTPCGDWQSLGLRVAVDDRTTKLPQGGPTFVVAAGENAEVELAYTEPGFDQRVSLLTGKATGQNIGVLTRPDRNAPGTEPKLMNETVTQATGAVAEGDRLVRMDGARLYFFEPGSLRHPERATNAYLHFDLSFTRPAYPDLCSPPCGFVEGVVTFEAGGVEYVARDINPDDDVTRLVCVVPAGVQQGTLVIEGAYGATAGPYQYVANLSRTTFPVRFGS
jgi:uncharacterized caspase-like protein